MKKITGMAGLVVACLAAAVSADTVLTSANFDLDGDATWSAGVPSASGDPVGVINSDYNFDDLGSGNVNGNFNAGTLGAAGVTQTAGNGLGDQYNVYGNANFAFNLNGGSMTSDSGTFFVNGTTFNIGGGDLDAVYIRLSGGGTLSMTSGSITTSRSADIFDVNNSVNTLNLTGGNIYASAATILIDETGIITTIGGDLSVSAASCVNLFEGGNHGNSSTINFTTNWTGSLTLDSATAWDDIFEAGDVSVDGVELGAGDFETYFKNDNGVITAIPEPATLGLVAAFGGAVLFIRRRFMI